MKPKSILRSVLRGVQRSLRRRPRIVMTLLCRDEEDIVGCHVAYHLAQGVDFVIATDNASLDRTPELLERFARLGKLHLIHEPSLTHDQAVWVTRMAQMAAREHGADWVINSDADEFWFSSRGTLREALRAVPRRTDCLLVPRFDMVPARDTGRPFYEAMLAYGSDGKTVQGRPLPRKACHRAYRDIRVADGNHHVRRPRHAVVEESDHPLQILHFPIRSLAQLERKVRQGAEALQANTRVSRATGRHWHDLYRDYLLTGRLEEYYNERAFAPDELAAGIASGRFVEDTRIRDALRRLERELPA